MISVFQDLWKDEILRSSELSKALLANRLVAFQGIFALRQAVGALKAGGWNRTAEELSNQIQAMEHSLDEIKDSLSPTSHVRPEISQGRPQVQEAHGMQEGAK